MSNTRVVCDGCRQLIDPRHPRTLIRRLAYINENRPRGANAAHFPGPVAGYLCGACAERRRLGIAPGQEELPLAG